MKELCIFGSGGFAKEVFCVAQDLNFPVASFIDLQSGPSLLGVPVNSESYFDPTKHTAIIGIGQPNIRKKITQKIINQGANLTTLIHPKALISCNVSIGPGSIICGNCILTCDITLGRGAQLNLGTTIGHDAQLGDFFTTAPGVHISGKVKTGECVYFGTNSCVIEGIEITDQVTIGAGACVTKHIASSGTYIGIPAKKLT